MLLLLLLPLLLLQRSNLLPSCVFLLETLVLDRPRLLFCKRSVLVRRRDLCGGGSQVPDHVRVVEGLGLIVPPLGLALLNALVRRPFSLLKTFLRKEKKLRIRCSKKARHDPIGRKGYRGQRWSGKATETGAVGAGAVGARPGYCVGVVNSKWRCLSYSLPPPFPSRRGG